MSLLSDSEKVKLLISILDDHIDKLPREDNFANYLETIRFFLKTKDPIIQKAAVSTSGILIENAANNLRVQISIKQAVGTLIGAFDKVGYPEAIDAAAVILKFEELLERMSPKEAKGVYDERWTTNKEEPSLGDLIEHLESYFDELYLEFQNDSINEVIQGKMEGLEIALKIARMHMYGNNGPKITE
ncbi:hypothetical protein M0651_07470 [Paenibacillus sp. MBLB2552]|uniref:Uncharacterized protein n=1 Tax=Paenibacillus mellifer TaxID=2937794 RepID=A0A9X1XX84_9BACL|nr:hypothetical protein [Paenibacillus mellifer]MCK8487004.1 hypothetical protein [Paenibacillus mellifer]